MKLLQCVATWAVWLLLRVEPPGTSLTLITCWSFSPLWILRCWTRPVLLLEAFLHSSLQGRGGGGQGSSKVRFSHTYYSDSVLPSVGSLMSRKVGMLTVGFPTVATIGRLFSHMISHVFDKIWIPGDISPTFITCLFKASPQLHALCIPSESRVLVSPQRWRLTCSVTDSLRAQKSCGQKLGLMLLSQSWNS